PGALRIRGQARVHPRRLAASLAARAGCVASGVEMLDVVIDGARVTTVRTSHGDIHPGVVVFATGVAPTLPEVPELTVPQRWVKGHLVATAPAPLRLRTALAAVEGLVLQLPGGEMVAGGTLDEGDRDPEVRDDVIDRIRAGLATLLPRTAGIANGHAWCCFRPTTADEQPVIDRVPGIENAWVTCGHFRTGILMAAATGDVLARWIRTGDRPAGGGAFGIDRFGGWRGGGGGGPLGLSVQSWSRTGQRCLGPGGAPITTPDGTDISSGSLAEPDNFGELLGPLRPADLDAPTRCDGWDVRDVAGHMVGQVTDVVNGRLEGLGTPEVTEREAK